MAVRPRPTATINAPRWAAGPGRCVFYFAPRLGRSEETYGAFGAAATLLIWLYVLGTAKLLRDEQMHPVELRESVTSPGGTTIRAIRELEQAGVRAAFLNATLWSRRNERAGQANPSL